ncbi:MAG: hypothetical protein QM831_13130 [Kofleriaceae bacterium]
MLFAVALATEMVWGIARYAGEAWFGTSPYLAGMHFGVWFACNLVAAGAMLDLASRLSGGRKVGALVAAGAFTVYAGCVIARTVVVIGSEPSEWLPFMYDYGYRALDVFAILGLAIAAGRRAMWVAAPAIGLAVMGHPLAMVLHEDQLWFIALQALRVTLLLVMAQEAERFATADTSYRRLGLGMRWFEIGLWIAIAVSLASVMHAVRSPATQTIAVIAISSGLLSRIVIAIGAWHVVRSRMREVPRWPFAIALVMDLWMAARIARNWTITLTTKWNAYDKVKLSTVPTWVHVPAMIGSVCVPLALVVLARRVGGSPRMPLLALVLVIVALAAEISPIPSGVVNLVYAVADLALVLAIRAARRDVHLVHEREMHAHTFA